MFKKASYVYRQLAEFHSPKWQDLPSLDLYMDQVLSYLNQTLDPLNFEEDHSLLTSSMVNNYVKNSIVKPPVKKHYRTYHLAYLYVVVLMKRCYSLSEIGNLIDIYSNLEDTGTLSKDFNKFTEVFDDCLHDVMKTGKCAKEYFASPTFEQQLMTNVIRTLVYKIYADYCLLVHAENKENPS